MKRWTCIALPALTTFLIGCSQYDVKVNDRLVYSPEPVFTDYQVTDNHLKACIDQTIADKTITAPQQLTRLSCTHAGITTLEGIDRFNQLQELNLASNQLSTLAPLARLGQLRHLIVKENQLTRAEAVLSLIKLEQLDLSSNPNLGCGDLKQLQRHYQGQLVLPEQCE